MSILNSKQLPGKTFCLFALAILLLSNSAKAGLDSYEIYLNNKLLVKRTLLEPLDMQALQLNQAGPKDQLVIYYSQCNAVNRIGRSRSIVAKDENGNLLKEWKFPDAKGDQTSMNIPVSELIDLEKKYPGKSLTLYYVAQGRPAGQMLASFDLGKKNLSYTSPVKEIWFVSTIMLAGILKIS